MGFVKFKRSEKRRQNNMLHTIVSTAHIVTYSYFFILTGQEIYECWKTRGVDYPPSSSAGVEYG
jgi:hypothetical protein